MPIEFRLGTRGSQLALWQAHTVAARIADAGGPPCRIVVIKTSGDRLAEARLSDIGGKRLFVKEIEDALLNGEIDLAVHSSKDMSAVLPEGLSIAAVLPREDPLDAVVLPSSLKVTATDGERGLAALVSRLGQSPSIGTGSVRRIAQVARLLPSARFIPVRGNVDTRLRKVDGGEYDALILAAAGLRRLGFGGRISLTLPPSACVPAPGQGIVAIETRTDDGAVRSVVSKIDDPAAHVALDAERALVATLGGGCQMPIGALAVPIEGQRLDLIAVVVALDGSRAVRAQDVGAWQEAASLGARVAEQLVASGADDLLTDARRQQDGSRQPAGPESPAGGGLRSATMTDE